ncbi:metallophosphoesterase [Runella sp.]|jgi:hypothetical protein|uniref:metallophosphoesterase n=1 Tax=Runella sp. TaxID=1960881 RepID=UPI002601605E|nr:metallophosphoesterase [Runella sp.]
MKKYFFISCLFWGIGATVFAQNFTEILGRPTNKSITMSILFDAATEVYWEYGTTSGNYTQKTETYKLAADTPLEAELTGLNANTKYFYRTRYKASGATGFLMGTERTFQTPRPPGSTFTFAVEADPHLDENTTPESYTLTLKNILAKKPDFLIDLGDDFMVDKLAVKSQSEITKRTIYNRPFFNEVCHTVPLYIVLGNHEGEAGYFLNGTANSVPVMATNTRKLYYPNPVPNEFYSGNETPETFVGLRENYYSWEWGNALFVVLDPYWYSAKKTAWGYTLGDKQFEWFQKVLSTSKAKFKFVLCHQLVGGGVDGLDGRGGTEVAHLYEQGGYNLDGSYGFDTNRPGWKKTINAIMKENKVTLFLHGHDHFYGKQEKDGLIFQEVPQPSAKNITNITGTEYGYIDGVLMPNRGFLQITVGNEDVKVEYIRTYLPSEEKGNVKNGEVAHSYTISANVVTGINEIKEKEYLKVYPNATKGIVKIEFAEPTTNFDVRLVNTLGQILLETKQNELDLSQFPNGTYLLNIWTEKYQFNRKVVVSH